MLCPFPSPRPVMLPLAESGAVSSGDFRGSWRCFKALRAKSVIPPAQIQTQTNFTQQKKHLKLIVSHKIEMEPRMKPRQPRKPKYRELETGLCAPSLPGLLFKGAEDSASLVKRMSAQDLFETFI